MFSNRSQEFGSTIILISQVRKLRDKGVCDLPKVKLERSGRVILIVIQYIRLPSPESLHLY